MELQKHDIVIIGKILNLKTIRNPTPPQAKVIPSYYVQYDIQVIETLKGNTNSNITAYLRYDRNSGLNPKFNKGDRILIYAYNPNSKLLTPPGINKKGFIIAACAGSRLEKDASEDIELLRQHKVKESNR